MSSVDFPALAVFIFVTIFTPGPNNITSTALGSAGGFGRAFPFTLGVTIGVGLLMAVASALTGLLLEAVPLAEPVMRWIGVAYILWLAWRVWRSGSHAAQADAERRLPGLPEGIVLQIVNPKALIYALTVYGSFLAAVPRSPVFTVVSAAVLALPAWLSTMTWAAAGAAISRVLGGPRATLIVNAILALALVYSAVQLSGLLAG